jgi:hypothetical protein
VSEPEDSEIRGSRDEKVELGVSLLPEKMYRHQYHQCEKNVDDWYIKNYVELSR